jgi:hypothetical protein
MVGRPAASAGPEPNDTEDSMRPDVVRRPPAPTGAPRPKPHRVGTQLALWPRLAALGSSDLGAEPEAPPLDADVHCVVHNTFAVACCGRGLPGGPS